MAEKDDPMKSTGTSGSDEVASTHEPSATAAIDLLDFHSPEFNRTDDLNDLSANYLSFESLDGIVTAHEHHQMERRRDEQAVDSSADKPILLDEAATEASEAENRLTTGCRAPGASAAAQPQLISFLKDRCFHGRSRERGCRSCLDICPFGAIRSMGRSTDRSLDRMGRSTHREISIDHSRCQGCGACALVCPADAIRTLQPSQEELLSSLQDTLENRLRGTTFPLTLVITDSETRQSSEAAETAEAASGHALRFTVKQISHARLEVLLAALALGAGAVLVACAPQNPPQIVKAAESQVQMARAILHGIGLSEERCRFAVIPSEGIDDEIAACTQDTGQNVRTDPWTDACSDRRTLVRSAAQRLYHQSGGQEPSLPLPVGAPFGAVTVNSAACTLCMACASACPSAALSASGNAPRLLFRESPCHQCGICRDACPEGAIGLVPRLLCDPSVVEQQKALYEAEPLRCIECGVPFASRAMMDRIKEKLQGHWMYANERQLRRLQMCRTCSARDALASREMEAWNLR